MTQEDKISQASALSAKIFTVFNFTLFLSFSLGQCQGRTQDFKTGAAGSKRLKKKFRHPGETASPPPLTIYKLTFLNALQKYIYTLKKMYFLKKLFIPK